MVRDLTEGNVTKLFLSFAFPLFLSNALQAVYNLVDLVVVGQFIGGAGMSAVSIGGDLLHLLTFVAMGFSSAGQVLVAQDVGAKRMERVQKTIGTMFTFLLSASLVISLLCFLLREPILHALNTPPEAYAYTMDYTVTCIAGLCFIYGYNIVSAILRGMGDGRRPFVFVAIAAVFNIVLDLVFVCGCGMAVFGAALATVIGQGVSFLASLVYLYRRRADFGFDFKPASFRLERIALKRLLSLGIPMAIQSAAVSLSKTILMAWINSSGVVYSALAGIYNKVDTICAVISNSFTASGSAMVGQNLGAGKPRRVLKVLRAVLVCGMTMTAVFSVIIGFFSRNVYSLLTSDQTVLAAASVLVLPSLINFLGAGTRCVAFAIINGSGNTKLNLAVALIDGMISRIGLAALLGFALGLGCQGFWLGDALAGCVPILIGTCYLLSGKWRAGMEAAPAEAART